MSSALLAPNASKLLRTETDAFTLLLTGANAEVIKTQFNPDECPAHLLPYLAWMISIDSWDSDLTEEQQRQIVRSAWAVHSIKGTPQAVKKQLENMGYGQATIIEYKRNMHDGRHTRNASITHGTKDWAVFDVVLNSTVEPDSQRITKITKAINAVKPVRSCLSRLSVNQYYHNGQLIRSGLSRGQSLNQSIPCNLITRNGRVQHNAAIRRH